MDYDRVLTGDVVSRRLIVKLVPIGVYLGLEALSVDVSDLRTQNTLYTESMVSKDDSLSVPMDSLTINDSGSSHREFIEQYANEI